MEGTAGRDARGPAPEAAARAPEGFARLVLGALAHLHDPVALQTHPLARTLTADGVACATPGRAGEALRRRLLDAIAHLRPPAKAGEAAAGAWRRHRLLELRYVEAVGPRAVQEQLGIEKSQYYREHARAVAALASLAEQYRPWAPDPGTTDDSSARPPRERAGPTPPEAVGRAGEPASPGPELPRHLTNFVGREREVAVLREWLLGEEMRLVTLTGPGGIGKTRLAVEAAAAAAGGFVDGVRFVALAPLAEPERVASAIAQALGMHERGGELLAETLKDSLRATEALLVLDNFEHLLHAAPLVADLLTSCLRLKVLATSRAPLRVSGEQAYPVPGLTLPAEASAGHAGEAGDLGASAAVESVRLFVARARAARPGFALTAADAPTVAAICRRLDGLPLAIELAAARVRHLPPSALLTRLESPAGGLPLLTGGACDAPARQRTLRDTIAWSHALLSPAEQVVFRRLGVFAGGFTLAAAEAVGSEGLTETAGPAANADGRGLPTAHCLLPAVVLDGLSSLVDMSLVEQVAAGLVSESKLGVAGETRYRLLETIRGYALEQLEASGEAAAVRERHASYFLALAEAAEPGLWGPQQVVWLDRLEAEHANLQEALRWWEARGAAEQGLRMSAALCDFWHWRGHLSEGRQRLAEWLDRPTPPGAGTTRAKALWAAGMLAYLQGDNGAARSNVEEGLALAQTLGDQRGCARALFIRTMVALREGDPTSRALAEQAVVYARASGHPHTVARSLARLGTAINRTDPGAARAALEESLALFREMGDSWQCSIALNVLADVARADGAWAEARRRYEEALAIRREMGDRRGTAIVLHNLGALAAQQGNARRAAAHFQEGLALSRAVGDRDSLARCLFGLAGAAAALGQPARATQILGAVTPHLTPGTSSLHPPDPATGDGTLAIARAALGEAAVAVAWAEGLALSLEQAAALALAEAQEPAAPAAAVGGLSLREREVAALVAQGLSNREIAGELTITERTAENHVEHILAKLGFRSRAQIAAWVAVRGLATAGAR